MSRRLVYRSIRPKMAMFGIKRFLFFLAVTAMAAVTAAAVSGYIEDREYVVLIFVGITGLIFYRLCLDMVIKSLANEKRALVSRKRRLSGLDGYSLSRLEEEAGAAESYYDCIYLLDEYLFVPKAGLLLRYEEIKSYKSVHHSSHGVPNGVYVEICDTENIRYCFSVNRWRDYKREYCEFMVRLAGKGVFKNETARKSISRQGKGSGGNNE